MVIRDIKRIFSVVMFPLLIVMILVAVFVFHDFLWDMFSSADRFRAEVETAGPSAPLLFIGLQILQVVVFIIPGEIPQIAGGFLFGIWLGTVYSMVGISIGSALNYWLGRALGTRFVQAVFGKEKSERFIGIATSPRSLVAFFLLFLIPGIPKDSLCYVGGVARLRFGFFMLLSISGRLPALFGSVLMGNAAADRRWPLAVGILSAAVVLFFLGLIFRERLHGIIENLSTRQKKE